MFDQSQWPIYAEDNLFCHGARPMTGKEQGWVKAEIDPQIRIEETKKDVYLITDFYLSDIMEFKGKKVDTERLGITQLSGFRYENPDGSSFLLDRDYFGKKRSGVSSVVGPVDSLESVKRIKVW